MRKFSRMKAACRGVQGGVLAGLVLAAFTVGASPAWAGEGAPPPGVEIRRTSDGIPHVRAANWHGLGFGVGYAQAEDALCTLAESFVTYEGRRSWFFGADARPAHDATFGRPANLESDFFFKALADESVPARYRAEQPAELNQLIEGFAAGYNRRLANIRRDSRLAAAHRCAGAPWLRAISADDIYRRLYAAQIGAGYARFVAEIAGAKPDAPTVTRYDGMASLATRLAHGIGEQPALGSNALAFGEQASGERGRAVLFGNPHWYWGGPDRFYQMHLTIPGRLNVAGVAFLGVPLVMIGFNDHVAWSHTVSTARRFGLFELTLDPADPTRYRIDDVAEAMRARTLSVEVKGADGAPQRITRTLYQSRFGPLLDLSRHNAAFGWSQARALAIRDVNADNFRVFRNFFYWNQAASLDQFIAIQRREAAVPWVNTLAIGSGDGRVWYADVGAVPNAPDALRAACETPLGRGFARVDARTPVLDGSRAACDWQTDAAAAQPGALPAAAQPALLRRDYVANMNDSYWLSNVHQPLEGYPSLFGGERQSLSLRGRLGHRIAAELAQHPSSAAALSRRLRQTVLTPRVHSAELFKDELLAEACKQATVTLDTDAPWLAALGAAAVAGRTVELGRACSILKRWPNRGDADARGALLWEAFWQRLDALPEEALYRVAFNGAAPLETPRAPHPGAGRAAQALAGAVQELAADGLPLDTPLGARRYVDSGGRRLPLYGGCHAAGYFTVACPKDPSGRLGPNALGNSYLQVVRFGPRGVIAHTLLAHGQREDAVDGGPGAAPVDRYARKAWLHFPFRDEEIAADPALTRTLLQP